LQIFNIFNKLGEPKNMSDEQFDDIQKLIRLKRFEEPPAGYAAYTERFVEEFGRRQRAELLKQSSRALLWERVSTYLGAGQAKWLCGTATAAVVAAAVFLAGANWGEGNVSGGQIAAETSGAEATSLPSPEFVSRPVTIPSSANGSVQPVSTRAVEGVNSFQSVDSIPGEVDGANVIIYREF
jgi:hypothetical protein